MLLLGKAAFLSAQLQEPKTEFTLAEAQEYALINNTAIKNAKLDIESASKIIWENSAMGLPQVSAAAGYTDNLKLMTTLIPAEFFGGPAGTFSAVQFGTQHNANASITASQLIFSGPYIVGLQAATTYKEFSEKSLIKSESDVLEAVAKSYYSIILSQAGKDAIAQNLENMNDRLTETEAMYQEGLLDETDVDQLRITVSSLENELNSAGQMVDLSYKFLLYQMGYDLNQKLAITDDLDVIMQDLNRDLLLQEFNHEEHIDFELMTTQERLAYLQMKRIKFEYFPSVNAYLTHQQMAMRSDFNFFDTDLEWYPATMLGVNISIPIFSSGMRKARVGQNKIELEKTKNNRDEVAKGLELAVQQARIDFSSAYEKYLNQKESIELAQKVFDNTSIKYTDGLSDSFELTQASDQLVGVQRAYIGAMVELLNAKLSLDKALGNI